MPIPWLVVLQTVPWTDVIRNAPKVAEGAKKLWSSIGKKDAESVDEAGQAQADGSQEDNSIVALRMQVEKLEATTAALHEQMLASSELIKLLADQNAQLIQRIEANRIRLIWLGGAIATVAGLGAYLRFFAG